MTVPPAAYVLSDERLLATRGEHVDRRAHRPARGRAEWPFIAVCVFAPVWWAFGLLSVSFLALAPFMIYSMLRRRRRVVLPAGFAWWIGFLVVVAASSFALTSTAPGTLPEAAGEQLLGWATNLGNFIGCMVVVLWICSHDEVELPKQNLVRHFGVFGVWVVLGGYLGLALPHLQFTSPTELLLRSTIGNGPWMALIETPQGAQVQDILGDIGSARPAAPFAYTNVWGEMLSLLLVFAFLAWWTYGTRRTKTFVVLLIAAASIPALLSLNRGLWLGVGVMVVWLVFMLLRARRTGTVVMLIGAVLVSGAALVISPASDILQERAANGHSDSIRAALANDAIEGASASPLIGWGVMRQTQGSPHSIAIGQTTDCDNCGNRRVGSTGQLWFLMFAYGYLGAFLYFAFFLAVLWSYRDDLSPVGIGATSVIVLAAFYSIAYTHPLIAMVTTMAAVGLLHRNRADAVAAT